LRRTTGIVALVHRLLPVLTASENAIAFLIFATKVPGPQAPSL
jgi:hypothetical protein